MKIKMMSRWNASCGVSAHAEMVGRIWRKMGHELKVLAPLENNLSRTEKDEPYVVRCYELNEKWSGKEKPLFNPVPFLEDDFDVFVVQNLEMMPLQELLEIYPVIREKAKTVLVVHEGGPPQNPYFYKFGWDAVVCFDERYKDWLKNIYPAQQINIIPYPCYPLKKGDRIEARQKLNLPLDKKIIFNYGLGVFRHIHLLPTIERLNKKYPLVLLTLTHVEDWYDLFSALKERYKFIELRKGPISVNDLYTYLHASDVLLIHKDHASCVVVSSTAYLCMGAGCPLLVSDTNFFETLNEEVIKYKNLRELRCRLEDIFEKRTSIINSLKAAEKYVQKYSSYEIGKKFIELFALLKTSVRKEVSVLDIGALSEVPSPEPKIAVVKSPAAYSNLQNPALDERNLKSA